MPYFPVSDLAKAEARAFWIQMRIFLKLLEASSQWFVFFKDVASPSGLTLDL